MFFVPIHVLLSKGRWASGVTQLTLLSPEVVACAAGVVFATTIPPQPAFLARLVCLEQGASSPALCCTNGYLLALAAEEWIACLSLRLFLLIGHFWFLYRRVFVYWAGCFGWQFLNVTKYQQGICLTTGIVLGRQNEKALWKEKGMKREMKFLRQGGEIVFHIIFSMWLSSSFFFYFIKFLFLFTRWQSVLLGLTRNLFEARRYSPCGVFWDLWCSLGSSSLPGNVYFAFF